MVLVRFEFPDYTFFEDEGSGFVTVVKEGVTTTDFQVQVTGGRYLCVYKFCKFHDLVLEAGVLLNNTDPLC